jgi:hypothetical protein
MSEDIVEHLGQRLGRLHAKQRIGIEDDHEARVFGQGLNYFHPENWYYSPAIIRNVLKMTGLYWRARKNTERIQIRHYDIVLPELPSAFDGFTILQISDLHVDMNEGAMQRLIELLPGVAYDVCVLTGDYRGKTFGPFDATLEGMARVCGQIAGPIFGVLGNHDTIRMVPGLEEMGIRMLLRGRPRARARDHLVGIDDALLPGDNLRRPFPSYPATGFRSCCHTRPNLSDRACHSTDVERAHAWRPNLPARRHPHHPRCEIAATDGIGAVEVSRHGRVYLGRRRVVHRPRPDQLPAGNRPAPPALRRR